jgi:4-hydroxyphenylpyruvate dioxygenase
VSDIIGPKTITALRNPGGSETRFSLNSGSLRAPLVELARSAREYGFHGLELWAHDVRERNSSASVRAIMETHNLQVSAFQVLRDFEGSPEPFKQGLLGEAERLMDDMLAIGADTLLVCANTAPYSTGDRTQIIEELRDLGDMARQRRLRIAFEPLAWSRWLNTYEL